MSTPTGEARTRIAQNYADEQARLGIRLADAIKRAQEDYRRESALIADIYMRTLNGA